MERQTKKKKVTDLPCKHKKVIQLNLNKHHNQDLQNNHLDILFILFSKYQKKKKKRQNISCKINEKYKPTTAAG
jgi:hypothetical protein